MRPRVIMVLAVAAIFLGSGLLIPAAYAKLNDDDGGGVGALGLGPGATESVEVSPPPPATLAPAKVSVAGVGDFFSWALLDRASGTISGSKNITATNSTESMVKIWIVSDYLRRLGDKEPADEHKRQASAAIRDSDDLAAETLYNAGGRAPVIDRMIDICKLTDTRKVVPPGQRSVWWSYTRISARDAVRLGECVKNGSAAGPKWTPWVLAEMTKVRGTTAAKDQQRTRGGGRWGIIDGLPGEIHEQGPIAIKNGWTLINADGLWHLNCLAVTDDWVLAVLMRYPGRKGLDFGATVCQNVTAQLVTAQPGAALKVPVPLGQTPSEQS